jgi:two-component system, LuxR family, response regulator FixJ
MGAPRCTDWVAIVDDDASVRAAIHGVLKSAGFEATPFASGEDFLAAYQVDHPACIITDIKMPGMSGFDLQKHLANDGNEVPVIFISSHGTEKSRARAVEAGAIGFLDKPFDDEALLELVRRAVA